jgi:hypothetical protein
MEDLKEILARVRWDKMSGDEILPFPMEPISPEQSALFSPYEDDGDAGIERGLNDKERRQQSEEIAIFFLFRD